MSLRIGGSHPLSGTVSLTPRPEAAIKNIQSSPPDKLVTSLERKIKELTVLYEISQLIGSGIDSKEAFSDILHTFHFRLGMNRGTITLLNPKTGELEIRAAHGMTEEEIGRGRYLVGEGITGRSQK